MDNSWFDGIISIYKITCGGGIMITESLWIGLSENLGDICPEFFRTIKTNKKIKKAVLYVTAIGVYEAHINGKRIGKFVLAPGCTVYGKRLQYQVYDVTDMVSDEFTLSVTVGTGWYRGRISERYGDVHNTPCAVIAELDILYCDGTKDVVRTDEKWNVRKSNILYSDIYDGEVYDASLIDETIYSASVLDIDKKALVMQEGEIVCEHERIKPKKLIISNKGERIIDFGQNIAGYIEFSVNAKDGEKIEISHAEVLDSEGNFYTENYRSAKAKINYTCKNGSQSYKPHFTFFGFRYIRLDKYPENFNLDDFTAIAVYSDMKRTGYIKCSNSKINRLFENTIWSQRGNFIDIPTDCPQRDERMGWTGDAQVFAKTACYNYNVKRFFEKWLRDVCAEQFSNGAVPDIVPNFWNLKGSSTAWGDVITIVPWQIYKMYGDTNVLRGNFESMKKWVDFITNDTKHEFLWTCSSEDKGLWKKHYGDWLALDAPMGSYKGASDDDFIASVFYAYSTYLLVKAGNVLGYDVKKYETLYENIVKTFKQKYNSPKTQTEHVLLLYFNLTDEKEKIASALNDMIIQNGNKLETGFVGTPYLLHVLANNGYEKTAYSLLLQEEYPSWLYEINHGATTIWEHWDGINDSGQFWSSDMNSYNHYAYGSVLDWIYEKAAGIKIDCDSNDKIVIEPVTDSRVEWLDVSVDTVMGNVRSAWKYENGSVRYEITVPSDAVIKISGKEYKVKKGEYMF